MNKYLINTSLGLVIAQGKTETEAFVNYTTDTVTPLKDLFLTREELIKRGYTKLEKTKVENIFLLLN